MDPSQPFPSSVAVSTADGETSLSEVLNTQLSLAKEIQERLRGSSGRNLDPREYKDLVSAASGIVSMAHRTQEAVRTIETYEAFAGVVFEFLRERGDNLGEDLVAKLKEVASTMNAEEAFHKASRLEL